VIAPDDGGHPPNEEASRQDEGRPSSAASILRHQTARLVRQPSLHHASGMWLRMRQRRSEKKDAQHGSQSRDLSRAARADAADFDRSFEFNDFLLRVHKRDTGGQIALHWSPERTGLNYEDDWRRRDREYADRGIS
jgi:hypothetical protein